jgi:hypothetical protein
VLLKDGNMSRWKLWLVHLVTIPNLTIFSERVIETIIKTIVRVYSQCWWINCLTVRISCSRHGADNETKGKEKLEQKNMNWWHYGGLVCQPFGSSNNVQLQGELLTVGAVLMFIVPKQWAVEKCVLSDGSEWYSIIRLVEMKSLWGLF